MEIVGSIFVAIIFLTSYAAFGSNSSTNNGATTATTSIPQTVYATATSTAALLSYGQVININVACSKSQNVSSKLNDVLDLMEKNGSVSNFYSEESSQVLVQAANNQTYGIYQAISQGIGSGANCTTFTAQANIELPSQINFFFPENNEHQVLVLPGSVRKQAVQASLSQYTGNTINVSISTLVTVNGSIYGNMSIQSV